jgi:hypothetical protein
MYQYRRQESAAFSDYEAAGPMDGRPQAKRRHVGTDSEWDRNLPDPWLSTAFASPSGVVLFVRPDLPEEVKDRLRRAATEEGVRLVFLAPGDDTDLLSQADPVLNPRGQDIGLLTFFSPKDVEYALGWQQFRRAIEDNKVRQRNNLSGSLRAGGRKVFLKDLCGWSGKESLARFAEAMGCGVKGKNAMDEYKTCMHRGLLERPEDYLRYAVGDVRVLLDLHRGFLQHFQALQEECLGMDDLWTAEDIPMTCGALVARTLERWLYGQAEDRRVLQFAVRKLGLLDPDARHHQKSLEGWNRVVRAYRRTGDLAEALRRMGAEGDADLARFYDARLLHSALDAAGVRWWARRPATETSAFLALVHGGRCVNEHPYQYAIDHGLDIDIAGCYGEALRSLVYPLGLPHVWSWTPNEERPTLGEWLDANEGGLVAGLWTAVVEGRLPFGQDLVYSKLVKAGDIRRAALRWGDEDSDGDLPGELVLLRREIRNGMLTADVLEAVRKASTHAEWSAFRRLRLVTAAGYLRRDRVADVGGWCEAVLRDGGRCSTDPHSGLAVDTRTRAWVGVPLEGFVGRLADRRKQVKASGGNAGLEKSIKLAINTTYGILVSRHFNIGNTVVANNITARARVGVWMLAKALGLRQTITDGGHYTPAAVPAFAGKRAGLDTLGRMWEWHDTRRGRRLAPLAGLDWAGMWDRLPEGRELDRLALEHVAAFWRPYGLSFPFQVAHKTQNTFTRGAYWSKGDYAFLTDSAMVYAVRGKEKRPRPDMKSHPTFRLLDNVVAGRDDFPKELSYTHRSILKVAKFKVVQASSGYEELKRLRPGDDYAEERLARYNNTHFPFDTVADYLRRRDRKKVHRGRPVEWFERYRNQGVAEVSRHMVADRLR